MRKLFCHHEKMRGTHHPSRRTCLQVCPARSGPPGPSGVARAPRGRRRPWLPCGEKWPAEGRAGHAAGLHTRLWASLSRPGSSAQAGPCGLWVPGVLLLSGGPGPGGRTRLTLSAHQAGPWPPSGFLKRIPPPPVDFWHAASGCSRVSKSS